MTARHELPTHLGAANKPFLGLTLQQFFALLGAGAGGVILAGHLPPALPVAVRLLAGALLCLTLVVLTLVRPAGKPLLVWVRLLFAYAGQARVTVWTRREDG